MIVADLHIHSRFSRATSRNLTLEGLWRAAQNKGIHLLGSGDITHPAWFNEVEEKLVATSDGAYALKPELIKSLAAEVPAACANEVRFVLSGEISCIYKKNDQTRKIHCLVIMPDLEAARRLNAILDKIGNIKSDGRPILGLDARDLLEICLSAHAESIFIPAHIWTPWFSLFGSKSGFNSLEECFADLSGHITALETGLSSDPQMNWQLSMLDRYVLVSNSDAHNLDTLAREANLLGCAPNFPELRQALSRPGHKDFLGTIEFFPDEGKYHLDGHRNCHVRLTPEETRELNGICPVCHKPVTVGVLNRVEELADRQPGYVPDQAPGTESLTSLSHVLGQVLGKGPASKAVNAFKDQLLNKGGNELYLLRSWPLEEARQQGGELLCEALRRLRAGQVILNGGFDGQFGSVELFTQREKEEIKGQKFLLPGLKTPAQAAPPQAAKAQPGPALPKPVPAPLAQAMDNEQIAAIEHQGCHLRIIAGPGSGKTRVMVERIRRLREKGASHILAITFSNKAAQEIRERLGKLKIEHRHCQVTTFHSLGWHLLGKAKVVDEDERLAIIKTLDLQSLKPARAAELISRCKQFPPADNDDPLFNSYENRLNELNLLDLDDLVYKAFRKVAAKEYQPQFSHILVDEYQDVNPVQAEFLKHLSKNGAQISVIGDPRQAIYGFRGADSALFTKFSEIFQPNVSIELRRNYRSQAAILNLAGQLIDDKSLLAARPAGALPLCVSLASPLAEARWIAGQVLELLGGLDSRQVEQSGADGQYAPKDIAILYRLHQQGEILQQALEELGIPAQRAGAKFLAELDGLNFNVQKVSLLSMHAAKGLEFPVVFVSGVEMGLVPYIPPGQEEYDLAEESRLLFVALSRARERLFISRAGRRNLFGRTLPAQNSPLWERLQGPWLQQEKTRRSPARPRQIKLF